MTDRITAAREVLMNYQQADMDGIMVLASRQAIDEVIYHISAQDKRISHLEEATDGRRHENYTLEALLERSEAKIKALVEATDFARNRLEMMSGDAWNIDGRDLKRNLQGVFAEYDAALAAAKEPT